MCWRMDNRMTNTCGESPLCASASVPEVDVRASLAGAGNNPQVKDAFCGLCGESLGDNSVCISCLLRAGLNDVADVADTSFGEFEIERRDDGSRVELGRGATGVTYRARDKVLGREVALKVVEPAGNAKGYPVRERFLREARAAATLRHPNIAAVFQFGASEDGERCYCAMELVEGETLEARVLRDGPIDPEFACEIGEQAAKALIAAAERGLVHRDLKPGNIMLARDEGGRLQLKLIDFGLAKAATPGAGEMELTHGAFVGTPAFASPEQFDGGVVDSRTDVFALGATLWFALSGRLPFGGKTIEQVRQRQQQQAPPVEQLRARRVPRRIIQLLQSCLALDPELRPAPSALPREFAASRPVGSKRRKRTAAVLGVAAAIATAASAALLVPSKHSTGPSFEKAIAVLPFADLSGDKENAYFSDGVQEEILTSLAKIADLKVISRTSVMEFRDREQRDLPTIAGQLGVNYVLEGSVHRASDRLRVKVGLSNAARNTRIWTREYEGDIASLFTIESQIAEEVARAIGAALSERERKTLAAKPTGDPAAYDLYLRAMETRRTQDADGIEAVRKRASLLEQAVARDPRFTAALCLLARTNLSAFFYHDRSSALLEQASKAIEQAAQVDADAGEVHLARAVYEYRGRRDHAAALAELALAARRLPNETDILYLISAISGRQGRFDDSIAIARQAMLLDPRNAYQIEHLAHTYRALRRYDEARRLLDQLIAWQPEDIGVRVARATIEFEQKGDLGPVERVIAEIRPEDRASVRTARFDLARYRRDYHVAREYLPKNDPYIAVRVARALGDTAAAEAALQRAAKESAAEMADRPDDFSHWMHRARLEAALGNKEAAVAAGARAMELLPASRDAITGVRCAKWSAEVCAEVGATDRALAILEDIAPRPWGPNYGELQYDPVWDPLRQDERFQKIVASLAPISESSF